MRIMMKLLFLCFWLLCKWFATFELAPKNAVRALPTVTNSKADHKRTAPIA